MKPSNLFCFAILLSFLALQTGRAQEMKLIGIVVDARSESPLKGADVYLKNLQQGTFSDEDGYFEITTTAAAAEDTLVVSFLGYKEHRVAVRNFQNRSRISLQPASIVQDSVLVREDRIDLVQQEIPHARSVINFETIELRGSSEISDLFKTMPSVRIEGNDLSGRRIQIRGSDASEVNVYIDGILINSLGVENAADLSVIPVENIETLEVLKGANLALLGSGAFGGVVNITTKKNVQRSLYLKTKQGSFDSQYYISELNLPLSQNFIFNYFGQLNRIKPSIEYFPGEALLSDKTENEQVETAKQNHNLRLDYYLKEGELSAKFYGYLLDYNKPSWENNRQNYLFAGSYRGVLLGIDNLDISLSYLFGDDEVERRRIGGGEDRFFNEFRSDRLNVKLLKKFVAGKNEFQFLAEYFHDEVESNTGERRGGRTIPTYEALLYENRWSVAGVAAFQNYFNNRPDILWKTHLGLRNDYIATGENYLSPTAGFQLQIERPTWKLAPYFSFGKNVRIFSLLDNAYLELSEIDQADTTLQRLRPEESNSLELGANFSRETSHTLYKSMDVTLSLFRSAIFNKLIRLPSDPSFIVSQIGRNTTKGVEGSLTFNQVLRRFTVQAAATLLDISEPFLYPYKPESMVSLQLDYASGMGVYVTSTFFHEGESAALLPGETDPNDFVEDTISPFFDLDVSLGYRFRAAGIKFNLQAAGYNILDNSGFQFYLLKKRYFQVSLSAKY